MIMYVTLYNGLTDAVKASVARLANLHLLDFDLDCPCPPGKRPSGMCLTAGAYRSAHVPFDVVQTLHVISPEAFWQCS